VILRREREEEEERERKGHRDNEIKTKRGNEKGNE